MFLKLFSLAVGRGSQNAGYKATSSKLKHKVIKQFSAALHPEYTQVITLFSLDKRTFPTFTRLCTWNHRIALVSESHVLVATRRRIRETPKRLKTELGPDFYICFTSIATQEERQTYFPSFLLFNFLCLLRKSFFWFAQKINLWDLFRFIFWDLAKKKKKAQHMYIMWPGKWLEVFFTAFRIQKFPARITVIWCGRTEPKSWTYPTVARASVIWLQTDPTASFSSPPRPPCQYR